MPCLALPNPSTHYATSVPTSPGYKEQNAGVVHQNYYTGMRFPMPPPGAAGQNNHKRGIALGPGTTDQNDHRVRNLRLSPD